MLTKLYESSYMGITVLNEGTLGGKLKTLQSTVTSELDGLIMFVLIMSIAAALILIACQKRKLAYTVIIGGIIFAIGAKYITSIAEFLKGAV